MTAKTEGWWPRNLDKVGLGGSIFAALCCLGFPALLSIVSAIGLGFLIHDAILLPLLAVSLVTTLLGLYLGIRHHGSWLAFGVGAASALGTFVFIFVWFNKALAGVGIAGLVAASLLNVWFRMRNMRKVPA